MAGRLDGKAAVVTGGGQGVGRAYALALAAEGASLVVNDLGRAAADSVAGEIRQSGGQAVANYDDVSAFAAAGHIMQTAIDSFGRLDILIANAGIIRPKLLCDATEEDWTKLIAVHANGTFNCLRHAAPLLIKQGGGTIITCGIGAEEARPGRVGMGREASPGLAAYRAAKAAILALSEHAAGELMASNINVNCIMPGATETPMMRTYYASLAERGVSSDGVPDGWPASSPPEAVPPVGVFLCTDEGRHITGCSFHGVYRGSLNVVTVPAGYSTLAKGEGLWTVDELVDRMPAWMAAEGYSRAADGRPEFNKIRDAAR